MKIYEKTIIPVRQDKWRGIADSIVIFNSDSELIVSKWY